MRGSFFMNVIHYAGIEKNQSSGVSVIVPEIINSQSELMNICFYNYGRESFDINDKVIQFNGSQDDDYHNFPEPFNHPDIVVFHSPFGIKKSVSIAAMLIKERIPYIIVPHGCFSSNALTQKRIKKWIGMNFVFKKMFTGAAAIQFLSRGEMFASAYNDKGVVIPNGVRIPNNISQDKREIGDEGIKIVFIGRKDVYYKGLDRLIEACSLIKKELNELNVSIYMYGPYDKDGGTAFKQLIESKNVKGIVNDLPPVFGKEKENVLISSDIFILTSRSEGLPGVVLEAWSCGCPTLLTDGTNMADEACKNKCGWKALDAPKDIADKILHICRDRSEIAEMSEQARTYVRTHYNWKYIAKLYEQQYRKVLE